LILVFGFAGIAAVGLRFAFEESPWSALPIFFHPSDLSWSTTPSVVDSWQNRYSDLVMSSAIFVFFLAPLLSLAA